jgi:hypothetical protein
MVGPSIGSRALDGWNIH